MIYCQVGSVIHSAKLTTPLEMLSKPLPTQGCFLLFRLPRKASSGGTPWSTTGSAGNYDGLQVNCPTKPSTGSSLDDRSTSRFFYPGDPLEKDMQPLTSHRCTYSCQGQTSCPAEVTLILIATIQAVLMEVKHTCYQGRIGVDFQRHSPKWVTQKRTK